MCVCVGGTRGGGETQETSAGQLERNVGSLQVSAPCPELLFRGFTGHCLSCCLLSPYVCIWGPTSFPVGPRLSLPPLHLPTALVNAR